MENNEKHETLHYTIHKVSDENMIEIKLFNEIYAAKLDDGANCNLIDQTVFENLPHDIKQKFKAEKSPLRCANDTEGTVSGSIILPIIVGRQKFKTKFYVIDGSTPYQIYLGKVFHKQTNSLFNHGADSLQLYDEILIYAEDPIIMGPYSEYIIKGKLEVLGLPDGTCGIIKGRSV